jgi:release factor glutamine methyltransferase
LTVRDALDAAVPAIEAAGSDTARLDAELLIADALRVDRAVLHAEPNRAIAGSEARTISGRIRRRVAREPVAYILGRQGFRRLELVVDSRALIPRPETELLVEVALELPGGARVHEVGTGSGAVALALLAERPDLVVSASDASAPAVQLAHLNAELLGLPLTVEVSRGLPEGEWDLVVANLPYVREDEWDGLQPEIRGYEPRDALVSGADGLDAIRSLVAEAPSGTRLALEHAPGQAGAVRELLRGAQTRHDLSGRERVTVGVAA